MGKNNFCYLKSGYLFKGLNDHENKEVVLSLMEWILTLHNGIASSNGISSRSTLHVAPGIQTTP